MPVWIDHVADPPAWKADFLAPEARDVVRAVGAWVLCFRRRGGDADGADGAAATPTARIVGCGWTACGM